MLDADDDSRDDRLTCATCGRQLGPPWGDGVPDPDDDPAGAGGQPTCGECARAREFDTLWMTGLIGGFYLGGDE